MDDDLGFMDVIITSEGNFMFEDRKVLIESIVTMCSIDYRTNSNEGFLGICMSQSNLK